MLRLAATLMAGLLLWPLAAYGQAMQPIKASPSTPVEAAALGSGGGARLAPSDDIPPAELEAFVDGVVRTAMEGDHIAGVSVSVVQDGQVVLKKGYGFASFTPVRRIDPDTTLFRIGSITKTFTWILVMKAVEEGKIDLDAPVNKYLPPELQIPAQGFKKEIRVRDLMTHSPGFEDRVLGVVFAKDPARIRPLDRWLRETRPDRVREPGLISSYSNYGAALAGAAVANVEGMQWQDLVEQRIFQPLGQSDISVREPYPARGDLLAPISADLARDLSLPFRWSGGAYEARSFEYVTPVAPAGVISASAGDMARYMLMLLGDGTLDGVTIFGPAAAKAFRTPMTKLPAAVGNWDGGFIDIPLRGGWHSYSHDGGTLSFLSNMMLVPGLRLGIFISTNTEGAAKLSEAFPARLVANFYSPPHEPPDPGTLTAAEALPYLGQYIPTRRPYSGLGRFVSTLQLSGISYSPEGYLLASVQGQVLRLAPTDKKGIFKSADGPGEVMFELKNGRAVRIITSVCAADRAPFLDQTLTLAVTAVLALIAAIGMLVGLATRRGRGRPRTKLQAVAAQVQTGSAAFWLVGLIGFGMLAVQAIDVSKIAYDWPTPSVIVGSSACLVASMLALISLGFVIPVWIGRDGWTIWRKVQFSLTSIFFAAFGVVLALRGALEPWTS